MKRGIDECGDFAKKLKMKTEKRAEKKSKNFGEGVDIDYSDVVMEVGAASLGEPDVKFDEAVFEFINSTWKEYEK